MKTPRVFVDELLAEGQLITLAPDAAKYLTRVLRRSDGDPLTLFNGDGFNYPSILGTSAGSATASVEKKEINQAESPLDITLVQSLAKGTKLDLVIQKATELGVNRVTPVSSERSILQVDKKRMERKLEHWRGVAVSAASQCQRSIIPAIDPPLALTDWLESAIDPASCLLLHPTAGHSLKQIKLKMPRCSVVVGPEGGFSAEEVKIAEARGVKTFSCGPRILRTETAGFTAIAVLQSLHGDF